MPKEVIINDYDNYDVLKELLDIKVRIPQKGDVKKILEMANNNSKISLENKLEILKINSKNKYDALY